MPDDTARSPRLSAPSGPRGRAVVTATLWSMLGIAALGLTRLAYSALVGRSGGPTVLGAVNNAISLSFLATFVTAGATGQAVTKYVAQRTGAGGDAAAVRRLLDRLTVVATLLAGAVLLGLAPWLFAGDPHRWRTAATTALLTLAYSGYTYGKSVLYGHQLARRYALLELVADGLALALTVAVLVADAPAWFLTPLIAGYATFTVFALWSAQRYQSAGGPAGSAIRARSARAVLPAGLTREIVGFVGLTCLGTVASQGFFQAAMVVAGKALTAHGAGLYAAAMTAVTPAFFLPRALALAFFPAAAAAVGSGDRAALARQVDVATRALATSTLPVFVAAVVIAPLLLRLVFGAGYTDAAAAVGVLAAAIWLYVLAVPSVNVLSAHGLSWARIPPFASAGGVLVGVSVWLVLILGTGRHTPAAVAGGYLAATFVQAGVPLLVTQRRLGPRRRSAEWSSTGQPAGRNGAVATTRPRGFGIRAGVCALLGATAGATALRSDQAMLTGLAVLVFATGYLVLLGGELRGLRTLGRPGRVPVDTKRTSNPPDVGS